MKTIYLYNKKHNIKKECYVDDEDYESVSKHKWNLIIRKRYKQKDYYLVTAHIKTNGKDKTTRIYNFIIGYAPKGMVTDHIDRNTLNNTKANLRHVTPGENVRNATKRKSTFPVKGITPRYTGYYNCSINYNGKKIHLKSGTNPKELYEKYYVPAHIKLFGEPPYEVWSNA